MKIYVHCAFTLLGRPSTALLNAHTNVQFVFSFGYDIVRGPDFASSEVLQQHEEEEEEVDEAPAPLSNR